MLSLSSHIVRTSIGTITKCSFSEICYTFFLPFFKICSKLPAKDQTTCDFGLLKRQFIPFIKYIAIISLPQKAHILCHSRRHFMGCTAAYYAASNCPIVPIWFDPTRIQLISKCASIVTHDRIDNHRVINIPTCIYANGREAQGIARNKVTTRIKYSFLISLSSLKRLNCNNNIL